MSTGADDWLPIVPGTSEMGPAVLDFGWSATPLGPRSDWPDALRSAVSICLTTSFPALVVWGPELTSIYNDAFRPILGAGKHPEALGRPAREVWPEIWEYIGPLFESVLTSGHPTWEQDFGLVIERNGFAESCFFTFSYSPLFDQGVVAGVLDLVVETTAQVVTARRLACLSTLSSALTDAERVTDACLAATAALASFPDDVRFADVYLRAGEHTVRVASTRRGSNRVITPTDLARVVEAGETVLVGDPSDARPADLIAVPIGSAFVGLNDDVHGALVVGLNRHRPFDHGYRQFVDALASAVTNALDGAFRRTAEVGEYRRVSDTLQQAMLPPAQDLPTIAARYIPAVGSLAVGGDWYDVVDLDDTRRALIVGDCVGHGLTAATAMGQLRSATRAMLLEGRTPAETLAALDTFAAQVEGAPFATVVCVVFDRPSGTVTCATAGHPPALVVGPRGHRWLDRNSGPPLAVSVGTPRVDVTEPVHDDEVLVLYTDGLIERRDESIDTGLTRLADAATKLFENGAQTIADRLLEDLLCETSTDDDVVLVVKHLVSAPVP